MVDIVVGFSEPDAGSDLAAVRTSAVPVEGGWLVNGTKVWTTMAHLCDYVTVLCRTSTADDRHAGLSQLIVDLHSSGVSVNPIELVEGTHHFNEVVFTNVFVPEEMVLGDVGMGWRQASTELAYERGPSDRYMSAYATLRLAVAFAERESCSSLVEYRVGEVVARFWAVRHLTLAVVRSVDTGEPPGAQVALAKDLSTTLAQEIVEAAHLIADEEIDPNGDPWTEGRLANAMMLNPIATIGGGTTEILRSIASKGLCGVEERTRNTSSLLEETVVRIFREQGTLEIANTIERDGWAAGLWNVLWDAGIPTIGVAESAGGSGGTVHDALTVLRWSGYFGLPMPLAEGASSPDGWSRTPDCRCLTASRQ